MSIKTIKIVSYREIKTPDGNFIRTIGEPFEAVDKQIAEGLLEACKKADEKLLELGLSDLVHGKMLIEIDSIRTILQTAIKAAED
jgi:hypothetical protein